MKVCEVCGAFLVVNDAESRVQSHLEGKQHVGYKKIRDTIDALLKSRRSRSRSPRSKYSTRSSASRYSGDRDRDRDRDYRSPRTRSRSRSSDRKRRDGGANVRGDYGRRRRYDY
eukprot:TRINITY_DN9467_c0_g1_i1.p1 TRINITY_DN9467_c0_g1~~TRINITY_DN9467_c0_g1_i1.p1  ORF type:complete len:114 (-),score=20.74 TRINITY_DN9467_c0_g1_i1:205-546(-)